MGLGIRPLMNGGGELCFPALAPEKRRKNGARRIYVGSEFQFLGDVTCDASHDTQGRFGYAPEGWRMASNVPERSAARVCWTSSESFFSWLVR